MKKFVSFVAAIVAFGFVGSASAADMPVKAPVMVAPGYNWTGFYIGINGGGGWTKSQESLNGGPGTGIFGLLIGGCGLATAGGDCQHSLHGPLGGLQFGYNWQSANWVFGLEGSFDAADIKGTETPVFFNVYTTKVKSLALVTGRVGYSWSQWLLYAKGGYAGGEVGFAVSATPDSFNVTRWFNGWTIGGGIEYGLTRNWVLGVEYDYVSLGKGSSSVVGTGGTDTVNVNLSGMQTVLGRLSYRF